MAMPDEGAIERRRMRARTMPLMEWRLGAALTRLRALAAMRREGITILVVMVMQFILASVFLTDFVVDIAGLRSVPPSYTFREVMQIVAWLGLGLGLVLNGVLLSRMVARGVHLERTVQLARGAFFDLLDERFVGWSLTPAEREVALLVIKGYSNSEIGEILGKAEGTVKAQCNAVFRKADVNGRVQFVCSLIDELLDDKLVD